MSGNKKSVLLVALLLFSRYVFFALLKKLNCRYESQNNKAIAAEDDKCIRISHVVSVVDVYSIAGWLKKVKDIFCPLRFLRLN